MNCPECGSEMTAIILPQRWMAGWNKADAFQCPDCGHESKLEGGDFKKAVRKKFGNPIDFSDIPIEEVGGGKE
jgi:DNA-directed RNA polymerase subunit M/transcription elongation factor TFIIS